MSININEGKAKNCYQSRDLPVYLPYPPYQGQKLFIDYVIDCLDKAQNAIIQSPTGTGKTLSLLCSTLSWVKRQEEKKLGKRKIIYSSRTHAQLKQVIEELVRSGFEVKMAVLASRDHTCLNSELKELSGQSKELECRLRVTRKNGLFCKYFHQIQHEEYFEKMSGLGGLMDLEDLGVKGKAEGFCPFFYQKTCKNKADLILMPYNYLFDQSSEEICSLINGSILILDEAHNIPNVCEQSKEFTITLSTLGRALQQLGELREAKIAEEHSNLNQQNESMMKSHMKLTTNEISRHASFISQVHSHLQILSLPHNENGLLINGSALFQSLESATSDGQFGVLSVNIDKLMGSISSLKSDIVFRPFWALHSWISLLEKISEIHFRQKAQKESKDTEDHYKCQIGYLGSDIKLSFICLDPKAGFQTIFKMKPYSIILASGTLSPLNSLPLELQTDFAKPLACPHILSKEQVNGCLLTIGPNGSHLNFSYENRDKKQMFRQLGEVLLDIASKTPNGVIVFVSSYSMIQKIKMEMMENGLMSQLYSKKTVFFEKKNSEDFRATLSQYLKEAVKPVPSKGALLFALARGKISEGMDFSDEKCRAVVLVGVPYPASKDLKVVAKMAYLDQKSKVKKSMNGNQWYICETIRCINQIIGRIVRNKNDYGSIYLLDERFKKSEIFSQISSWARECIKVVTSFDDFKFKLDLFHKHFQSKNHEEQQADHFFKSINGSLLNKRIELPQINLVKGSISVSMNQNLLPKGVSAEQNDLAGPIDLHEKYKEEIQEQKEGKKMRGESREKIIFGGAVAKKKKVSLQKECPVCRHERKLVKNIECVHEICEECWEIWLKKDLRCPLCRVRIREKYLIKDS